MLLVVEEIKWRFVIEPGESVAGTRLSLAPGQRFASKGGYIVRFTDAQPPRVAPVGEWITP